MKSGDIIRLCFIASAIILASCAAHRGLNDNSNLQSYYAQADSFFVKENIDSSLYYIHKCFEFDRNYAPAHYLLGKIYLYKDGIYNRRLSADEQRLALKVDQENPEYHFSLATTLLKQGFDMNALAEFKKTVELNPADSRPYIKIAEINQKLGLRYDDPKFFERAVQASAVAAKLSDDPAQFYQQAVSLYQMDNYDSSILALKEGIAKSRDSSLLANCLLLLGAELVDKGQLDSANAVFTRARKNISDIAQNDMDDIRYLLPPAEYAKIKDKTFYDQEQFTINFWGQLDPDPTTGINERKLEHYARFVHAQLTYSIPDRKIEGWRTKRGEMYIRYGPPSEQSFSLGSDPTDSPKWIWTYDKLPKPTTFIFEDTFLNGDFDFPFPNKSWTAADFANNPALFAAELQSTFPEQYSYNPGTGPLAYDFMPRQFKGTSGKTDFEVYVAIPVTELKFRQAGEYADATINWRQTLHYQSWRLADSAEATKTYRIRAGQTENSTISMADRMSVSEYPDSMLFSISIRDTLSGHTGVFSKEFRLKNFYSREVEISDIVLARRIDQPPGQLLFKRKDLGIYSNLDNRYFAGEPIWLYFEIYNLKRGPDSLTSYTITQTIAERRGGNILGSLRNALSGKNLHEVITTYNGGSIYTQENRILQIDASQFTAGDYIVSIEINDLLTGKSAKASEDLVIYK